MKNPDHTKSIALGTFFMVCTGESYSAEIVPGNKLLEAVIKAVWGEMSNCPKYHLEFYRKELEEPDNWLLDRDLGPISWSMDVGETDHIQLFLIVSTVHHCPPIGSGVTQCCGKTPFEIPVTDRITNDPDKVTCRAKKESA